MLIKHETRETEVLQGMSEVVDMWQTKCSGTVIFSQLMCQHIARDDFFGLFVWNQCYLLHWCDVTQGVRLAKKHEELDQTNLADNNI